MSIDTKPPFRGAQKTTLWPCEDVPRLFKILHEQFDILDSQGIENIIFTSTLHRPSYHHHTGSCHYSSSSSGRHINACRGWWRKGICQTEHGWAFPRYKYLFRSILVRQHTETLLAARLVEASTGHVVSDGTVLVDVHYLGVTVALLQHL